MRRRQARGIHAGVFVCLTGDAENSQTDYCRVLLDSDVGLVFRLTFLFLSERRAPSKLRVSSEKGRRHPLSEIQRFSTTDSARIWSSPTERLRMGCSL